MTFRPVSRRHWLSGPQTSAHGHDVEKLQLHPLSLMAGMPPARIKVLHENARREVYSIYERALFGDLSNVSGRDIDAKLFCAAITCRTYFPSRPKPYRPDAVQKNASFLRIVFGECSVSQSDHLLACSLGDPVLSSLKRQCGSAAGSLSPKASVKQPWNLPCKAPGRRRRRTCTHLKLASSSCVISPLCSGRQPRMYLDKGKPFSL